jgi:hypothetical protein
MTFDVMEISLPNVALTTPDIMTIHQHINPSLHKRILLFQPLLAAKIHLTMPVSAISNNNLFVIQGFRF